MAAMLNTLIRDTRGATAVEYALLIACIFLGMAVGTDFFGQTLAALWDSNSRLILDGMAGS